MLLADQPARAWNSFGHEVAAYVAYQHLAPPIRERANALLKLNPMYGDWLKQVSPDADQNTQIFMMAAIWPDLIEKAPGYANDKVDSQNARQNIGYADKNMHTYWHYCRIPYTQDQTKLPALPSPNAREMIPEFRELLKSNASDELKSYDLCWIMHMAVDVHQPLHCINRACEESPKGDNGAHDVRLTDAASDLHDFWDGLLGPDGPAINAIAVARTLAPADDKLAKENDPKKWVKESHLLAIEKIYRSPIGTGDGPYTLTAEYKTMAPKLSKERVELAGERLANLLNDALK
ncbi:MAG TPA: S1/P1 nuclease [Planktothrix sp.]